MPELPEVETVKRGLNQVTLNQSIKGGDVLLARTIAHPLSALDFLAGLKNAAIVSWHRRGKYLLAELAASEQGSIAGAGFTNQPPTQTNNLTNPAPAGWLGVHLRMTGQLLWLNSDAPLHKHTRVRLFFGEDRELRFVDQRTFGKIWWVSPTETSENVISGIKKLGPEPFSEQFTVDYLAHKLRSRRRPIKNALLDQELVAGLGNIYADEALFLAGVQPTTLCTELKKQQIERIQKAVIEVLQTSIEAGGTTFSNFLNVEGINGNYGGVAWVYNRDRQPCRVCGNSIQRLKLAGRSAHFCPHCQG